MSIKLQLIVLVLLSFCVLRNLFGMTISRRQSDESFYVEFRSNLFLWVCGLCITSFSFAVIDALTIPGRVLFYYLWADIPILIFFPFVIACTAQEAVVIVFNLFFEMRSELRRFFYRTF